MKSMLKEWVKDESGFPGAVTVLSREVDGDFGIVTVKVPFLDIYGEAACGLAQLIVHRRQMESEAPLPVFNHVYYQWDLGQAKSWAERGWLVATPFYNEEFPIAPAVSSGNNQVRATMQWLRRLPFVDRLHVLIEGTSQGGYMALDISADFFPVCATISRCPIINWGYNSNHVIANKEASGYGQCSREESPLPCVYGPTPLVEEMMEVYGSDFSHDTWYDMSPLSYLTRISSPVLLTVNTGDMMVPLEQMTRDPALVGTLDRTRFPKSYTRDFDALTLNDKARRTFFEVIPEERCSVHHIPLQEKALPMQHNESGNGLVEPDVRADEQEHPWDPDCQWSINILLEGPPVPTSGHFGYWWSLVPYRFAEFYRNRQPSTGLLTEAILQRLMERYALDVSNLPQRKNGEPVNRLNYPDLEKRDVIQGLLDFASMGEEYADRLEEVYAALPLKPLGETLDVRTLRKDERIAQ